MKGVFILFAVLLTLTGQRAVAQVAAPVAQSPAVASAIAAQQDAEERYKRMAADIEALQTGNESLKAKIAVLEQKIEDLRQQLTSATGGNSGIQADLKRLAENVAEVDRKRQDDKQAISEEIRKSIARLEKSLGGAATPARGQTPKSQPDTSSPAAENGFSYTIHEGDNLSAIVKAYNADYKSKGWKTITLKQAREANPNVDWNRLLVGQKIIIPRPEGQ